VRNLLLFIKSQIRYNDIDDTRKEAQEDTELIYLSSIIAGEYSFNMLAKGRLDLSIII